MQNVSQCWIDDVEIQNSDFGIDLNATNFCTVRHVTLTTSESRAVGEGGRDGNGHHGIDISHGTENLVTNFDVQTKFVHDISVEWYALHSVFKNGRGVDLNMVLNHCHYRLGGRDVVTRRNVFEIYSITQGEPYPVNRSQCKSSAHKLLVDDVKLKGSSLTVK